MIDPHTLSYMFHRGRSSAICVTIQCTVITLLMVRYCPTKSRGTHYFDVIMGAMASQITSLTVVHSKVHSGADQRKHQSSASLAFMRGIHRRPVNSPTQMASNAENDSIWWSHHEDWNGPQQIIQQFFVFFCACLFFLMANSYIEIWFYCRFFSRGIS